MNTWKRLLRKMKAPQFLAGLLLTLSFLAGCAANYPGPDSYLLPGAGLGAALGAGLGAASSPNNRWAGAAIGGLLGTAVGGVGGEIYGRSVNPPPSYQAPPTPPAAGYGAPPEAYGPAPPPPPNYSYTPPPPAYN